MLRGNEARMSELFSLCSRACQAQLLSPWYVTTEACVPRACVSQEKPPR